MTYFLLSIVIGLMFIKLGVVWIIWKRMDRIETTIDLIHGRVRKS